MTEWTRDTSEERHDAVAHLRIALEHRTTIGTALGILVARLDVDQEQAFAYLSRVSQNTNTKVYDLAREIVATRQLPDHQP